MNNEIRKFTEMKTKIDHTNSYITKDYNTYQCIFYVMMKKIRIHVVSFIISVLSQPI